MSDFGAVTTCNSLKLLPGAVEYLQDWSFDGDMEVDIDEEGKLVFYGYKWPFIRKTIDDEDDSSFEFYDGLQKYVPKGKTLVINMIGHEKCIHPVSAQSIVITSRGVKYHTLPA